MKRISRRDRLKIYGDLLSALNCEDSAGKLVLTGSKCKSMCLLIV